MFPELSHINMAIYISCVCMFVYPDVNEPAQGWWWGFLGQHLQD